jgi:hypothetical protein
VDRQNSQINIDTNLAQPHPKTMNALHHILSTLFLLFTLVSSVPPQRQGNVETPSTAGVIVLNAQNFDSNLRDGKVWLVEFYAPW